MARALSVDGPAAGIGVQVATIWIWAAALSVAAFAMRPRVPGSFCRALREHNGHKDAKILIHGHARDPSERPVVLSAGQARAVLDLRRSDRLHHAVRLPHAAAGGPTPTIALIDRDTGVAGERLQRNLDALGYKVHRTATGDPNEWRVEIQRDTTGLQPIRMTLHGGAQESAQERAVRFDLESALARLSVPDGSSGGIEIATGRSSATPQKVTRGFQRSVPAYLIMFLTLNLLVAGANLAEDRENGRLRRMLLSPAGKPSVILGKLMARLTVGWTQMALIFATGVLVFRVTFAAHPVLLVGFLSLYALAIGAVGILIGALFRDPDQAHTVAIWTTIVLAPLQRHLVAGRNDAAATAAARPTVCRWAGRCAPSTRCSRSTPAPPTSPGRRSPSPAC